MHYRQAVTLLNPQAVFLDWQTEYFLMKAIYAYVCFGAFGNISEIEEKMPLKRVIEEFVWAERKNCYSKLLWCTFTSYGKQVVCSVAYKSHGLDFCFPQWLSDWAKQ